MKDSELIGLSLEKAYMKIIGAGLSTNLVRDKKTGEVSAFKGARIMILMPDYITVKYDHNNIVTSTKRG